MVAMVSATGVRATILAGRWFAFFASVLALTLPPVGTATEERARDRLDVFHEGGFTASGIVQASCTASLARFTGTARGQLIVPAPPNSLVIRETWINETFLTANPAKPVELSRVVEQVETRFDGAIGEVEILWEKGGRVQFLPAGGPLADESTFQFRLHTGLMELGRMGSQPRFDGLWIKRGEAIEFVQPEGGPAGRAVKTFGGLAEATGDFVAHMENVTIRTGHIGYRLPPRETFADSGTPGVLYSHVHVWDALLAVKESTTRLDGGLEMVCGDVLLDLDGDIAVHRATGLLHAKGLVAEATEQEIQVNGRLGAADHVRREGGRSAAQFVASGQFEVVEIDFSRIFVDESGAAQVSFVVTAGVGAVVLAVITKAFLLLYARVHRERLLDSPHRQQALSLIEGRPGIAFHRLAAGTPVGPSTLRYHLRVMERYGKITSVLVKGRLRFFPETADAEAGRKAIILSMDEKVSSVVAQLANGSQSARGVAKAVQARWNLSRSGSWRVIDRAFRAGLIEKQRSGRVMILRPAGKGPSYSGQ